MLKYIKDLGIRIKLFRNLKSYTQAEVDYGIGKYNGFTSSLERGKNTITHAEFVELCRFLDVSEEMFLSVNTENVKRSNIIKLLNSIDTLHKTTMFQHFKIFSIIFENT